MALNSRSCDIPYKLPLIVGAPSQPELQDHVNRPGQIKKREGKYTDQLGKREG